MSPPSRAKVVLLVFGACLHCARSAVITTPTTTMVQSPANSSFGELNLGVRMDSRLRIHIKYFDTDLSARSCLMNVVETFAILADMDYNGVMPATTVSAPNYPDVEIQIRPSDTARTIEVKYAVMGLYYAIVGMVLDPEMAQNFKIATFGIYWKDEIVAWIWIQPPDLADPNQIHNLTALPSTALLNLTNTTPIVYTQSSSIEPLTNTMNITNATNTDVELAMSYFPQGAPLTERAVFIAIFACLKDAAEFPSHQLVDPFSIGVGASNVRIEFDRVSNNRLTAPPSFEYRWVVEAAKLVSVWMIEHRFWESFFTIMVNGLAVGEGAIVSGLDPGRGLEGNATTS